MTTTAPDRRWLRLAAAVAVALLAIGLGAASLADSAGAKKASKGKKHKQSKSGGKAGVYLYKGKADLVSEVSEFKVKLNGSGMPVKVVGFTMVTPGICSSFPAQIVTEWSTPTPVKTKKARGKSVRYFKQALSGVDDDRTRNGGLTGTFDPSYKKLAIATDAGYTKPLGETILDCQSTDGVDLHKAGKLGGGKSKGRGGKSKGHGGKTREHRHEHPEKGHGR